MDVVGAQLVEIQESIEVFRRARSELRASHWVSQEPLASLNKIAVVAPHADNRIACGHVKFGLELRAYDARTSSKRLDEPKADLSSARRIETDRSPAKLVHVLEPR